MQGGRLCFGGRSQYDLGQSSVTLFPLFCLVFGNIQYQIIYVKHWRGTTQYQIIYANHLRGNKQYQINISVAANLALSFFHTCFKIFKIALCMCCVVFNPKVFRYSKNLFANCTFRGCLQTWRWLTFVCWQKIQTRKQCRLQNLTSLLLHQNSKSISISRLTLTSKTRPSTTLASTCVHVYWSSIEWVFSSAKAHINQVSTRLWLSQGLTRVHYDQ